MSAGEGERPLVRDARSEAARRWPWGWDVEDGTFRDGTVNGFVLGAEWQASRPITDEQVEAAAEVLLADYQMEYDGGELNEFIDLARVALEAARGVQS